MIPRWASTAILLGLLLLVILLGRFAPEPGTVAEVPYTSFKALLAERTVDRIVLRGDDVEGHLVQPRALKGTLAPVERFRTRVPAFGDPELLPALEKAGVEVAVEPAKETGGWGVLAALVPWFLLLGFYFWFWQRMYRNLTGGVGGVGGLDKFLRRGAKSEAGKRSEVTFADVAGQESAKREVAELVDFLRNPERYRRLGADVPHGILLMGPPGTGKTLLARALAGEAGVPFFSISASEFIEVFVGVGASRVRNLFEDAKKNQPSILFIDELDSIGRVRGTGLGGGHDEREQTLNQILAELDGFSGHEAVIVLAATNRPDVLDPALLRPGRFDRHIVLELPDRKAREEILRVHTRKVPLAKDVDLAQIAAGTPGFSGADLKNLVNEAAMMAARENAVEVSGRHIIEMRERVMMGAVRSLAIQPDERHRLAVHEAGHTTVAHFLAHADPLLKVTIIPRGRTLGSTQQLPVEERYTLPEEYLRDRLAVILGGRAAERIVLGSVSSGADDDIRQATALARAMVSRWGMSEEVGPVDVRESEEHPFLGREIAQPRRTSEFTSHAVDQAVRALLLEAEDRATQAIREHESGFGRLIAEIEAEETLERMAIEGCLGAPRERQRVRRASVA
ncbi:MAG: ATP-dependent zinc metalloprotease FtsH [Proteobacteria bacterium]|nr:ATP-dependent zinc metalloprotease FtsH [Pseudomonadota bacterium]